MQNFNTINDLILFACSENDLSDAEKFLRIRRADKKLSREFSTIIRVKNYLRKIQIGPSESVIKNIMGFSKAFSVNKTRASGNFNLLLN
ncbi:MAG: hypothetical protein IH598_01505 [Bacteroidales bacterium]|nr:hypothetical protein [Bacteroidales bacterium]